MNKEIERIKKYHSLASGAGAIVHAVACGEAAIDLKAQLPRGEFKPTIEENKPPAYRTVADYMLIARSLEKLGGEWKSLSIKQALEILRPTKKRERAKKQEVKLKQEKRDRLSIALNSGVHATYNARDAIIGHMVFGMPDNPGWGGAFLPIEDKWPFIHAACQQVSVPKNNELCSCEPDEIVVTRTIEPEPKHAHHESWNDFRFVTEFRFKIEPVNEKGKEKLAQMIKETQATIDAANAKEKAEKEAKQEADRKVWLEESYEKAKTAKPEAEKKLKRARSPKRKEDLQAEINHWDWVVAKYDEEIKSNGKVQSDALIEK